MKRPVPALLKRAEIVPEAPAQEPEEQESLLARGKRYAKNVGVGVAGATAASTIGSLGSRAYLGAHGGMRGLVGGSTSRAEIESLARHAGLDPRRVHVGPLPTFADDNAFHMPMTAPDGGPQHVIGGKIGGGDKGIGVNQGTVAHELGHGTVTDFMHRRMGGEYTPLAWRLAGNAGMGLAGLGAVGAGMGSRNSAIAGTALALPKLADELMASHFGGRAMLRHRNPTTFGGKAKAYLSAYKGMPTYMLAASTPAVAYGLNRLATRAGWLSDGDKKDKDKPALLAKAGCVGRRKRG